MWCEYYACCYLYIALELIESRRLSWPNGAITNKIKHAVKLKTSPAKLAQLLHNCYWTVRRHWLLAKTKCYANEGCNSCASLAGLVLCLFYCTF